MRRSFILERYYSLCKILEILIKVFIPKPNIEVSVVISVILTYPPISITLSECLHLNFVVAILMPQTLIPMHQSLIIVINFKSANLCHYAYLNVNHDMNDSHYYDLGLSSARFNSFVIALLTNYMHV
jgi:hypothetical protein